jgi:hypothetical protein
VNGVSARILHQKDRHWIPQTLSSIRKSHLRERRLELLMRARQAAELILSDLRVPQTECLIGHKMAWYLLLLFEQRMCG